MFLRRWTLGLALMLTACTATPSPTPAGASSPSPVASASTAPVSPTGTPAADAVVMTIRAVGGLCPNGTCDSTMTVRGNGSYSFQIGPETPKTGTVSREKLDTLIREIARADFARIKSVPFTGTCPIAYDGQEDIYTFQTAAGPQEIASCKVQVDPNDPLFKAAEAVRAEIRGDAP